MSDPRIRAARAYEDFTVGDAYRSRIGRTVTESDNLWFTCLTMNTNQIHFNDVAAATTRYGKVLVNSTFTLALVTGLTVPDTSENGGVNLEWTDIKLPKPVFVGDTIWTESEITGTRRSESNPGVGIVSMRCRGINQNGDVVCEFRRTFMIPTRESGKSTPFPEPRDDWTV